MSPHLSFPVTAVTTPAASRPVFCVSSQINGLWRAAEEGCFPQRFTELISAAAAMWGDFPRGELVSLLFSTQFLESKRRQQGKLYHGGRKRDNKCA